MNIQEIKEKSKSKIDELFNNVEEFKVKGERIENQFKDSWDQAVKELTENKKSMEDLYKKISDANEKTIAELTTAFNKHSASAQVRVNKIKEIYSKTLN